jgi:Asp-tRNA(Asn)/Glu-tRNA(Gln) amidotransferase A subunit family amidase
MQRGDITSEQLTQSYLHRIAAFDQAGPRLNAVLYLNPDALEAARALDAERARGKVRGPLHGIPVLLKDNYETEDMPTTGGSLALLGSLPAQDAYQVKKLREAGAVLLGKVNLHELAMGLTTVSSLGGQTLNPYDLTRVPGGSSGGSAVATTANFAAFTMGTDTSGSIRGPSSHNSIVGLRPTAGLSSRRGVIPFNDTQDTAGPMCRTVEDLAIVLDATVGYDQGDPITAAAIGRTPESYVASLRADALKGARVGALRQLFGGDESEDEDVADVIRRALEEMKDLGAELVDIKVPDLEAQLKASYLMSQEVKFCLRNYLQNTPGAFVKSVEELLASGLHTAQFQKFLEDANSVPEDFLTSGEYKARQAARKELSESIARLMDENRLDCLAYPVMRRIAPLLGGTQAGSNAALSAQTGFPAIVVPAGFTAGGFPVGIELLGRAFAEPTILGLAFAFEQGTKHRRPPSTAPTLPIKRTQAAVLAPASGTSHQSLRTVVAATGDQSVPPSRVEFEAITRLSFNQQTRDLAYDIELLGLARDEVACVCLHQRMTRPNGGVAHILAKSGDSRINGKVTLTEAEAQGLLDGKFYVSAISRANPRLSARADIVLPARKEPAADEQGQERISKS